MIDEPPRCRCGRRIGACLGCWAATTALLFAVVAGGWAGSAGAAGSPSPGVGAPAILTTPVLSVRRAPTWIASGVATAALDTSLSAILANPALHAGAVASCLDVTQDGRNLFTANPTAELLPASNMKLFTATAVLDKLGPDSRFTTPVDAETSPVGGVVAGNLYLVGSGDPILRTPDFVGSLSYPEGTFTSLDQLASQVRAAGVTRVTGSVVADESRYDSARSVASWPAAYLADGVVGPLSAVDVNDGYATFSGGRDVASPQPAAQAAVTLTAALEAAGVAVSGSATIGATPSTAVPITSVASPPMADVLGAVLRPSDDTGAELLTKELGKRFGSAGTTAAGVAVIRADMVADGLAVSQLQAVDGSGLDRSDRATCPLVNQVLVRAGPSGALASALPVAGRTGTLDRRMQGTAAAGRVIAKTGTLGDVSALSGFVLAPGTPLPTGPALTTPPSDTPEPPGPPATNPTSTPAKPALSRDPLVFSLLENGLPGSTTGEVIGDRIGEALATYPTGPDPASLVPLPVTRPSATGP